MERKGWNKKFREENKDYNKNYYRNNKDRWVEYRDKNKFNCVYLFLDKDGKYIRIGSTNNLKNRCAQYFSSKNYEVYKWFSDMQLDKVLYIKVDTRPKAYALEGELIKKYNPILNQNDVQTGEYDEYIESLGDLENIEELFEEWDIEYYKDIYKNLL